MVVARLVRDHEHLDLELGAGHDAGGGVMFKSNR